MEKFITALQRISTETVIIHYQDGRIVEGFMKNINADLTPPRITLTESEGDGLHIIDFSLIKKLVIKKYGNEPVSIEL